MGVDNMCKITQNVMENAQKFRDKYIRKESIKAIKSGYKYICFFETMPKLIKENDEYTATFNISCLPYNNKQEEKALKVISNRFHQVYTLDLTDRDTLMLIHNRKENL